MLYVERWGVNGLWGDCKGRGWKSESAKQTLKPLFICGIRKRSGAREHWPAT